MALWSKETVKTRKPRKLYKIPVCLDAEIRDFVNNGSNYVEIQSWIQKKINKRVSLTTVSKRVSKIKQDSKKVAEKIYEEVLRASAKKDIEILDDEIDQCLYSCNFFRKQREIIEYQKIGVQWGKLANDWMKLRIQLHGVKDCHGGMQTDYTNLQKELTDKINKLCEKSDDITDQK